MARSVIKDGAEAGRLAPIAPTLEAWAAMSREERARVTERLFLETSAVLDEEAMHLGEGDLHQDAWTQAKEKLRSYFGGGRRGALYIATNMMVFYPGERAVEPDLFAVRDVPVHPRDSWMVHVEGKGIDLAMEFCKEGNRQKDFVDNVERYAALGIREYFAVDLKRGYLRGWRLPAAEARRYQPLLPQAGRFRSEVLDLELAFIEGTLQFFADNAVLQDHRGVVRMLEEQVDAERVRAEEERARAEEERVAACAAVAEAIRLVLQVRGLPLGEAERARLHEARDLPRLQRWLARAAEAPDAAAALSDA